jgi:L-ascorbate metabolism protein UlaG (beta-lactamase superfamily)
MRSWRALFIVPLGVGAHLSRWGIPNNRIVEVDWWESVRMGALEIVATPARHASGRTVNTTRTGQIRILARSWRSKHTARCAAER